MTASVRDRVGSLPASQDAFLRDLLELEREHEDDAEPAHREASAGGADVMGADVMGADVMGADVMGHGLAQLSEALDAVVPAQGSRERLLAEVSANGRFARFAEATAKLLDLGIERAQALLDQLWDDSLYSRELPGISLYWCEGGPAVANAVRGFLRVTAGTQFPEHEHIGDETVLVLQGSFVDTTLGLTFTTGDMVVMKAGTSHAYYVPEGGPDLLKLSVTQEGLRAMGHTYLPRA